MKTHNWTQIKKQYLYSILDESFSSVNNSLGSYFWSVFCPVVKVYGNELIFEMYLNYLHWLSTAPELEDSIQTRLRRLYIIIENRLIVFVIDASIRIRHDFIGHLQLNIYLSVQSNH